jgi:hypothetical protein
MAPIVSRTSWGAELPTGRQMLDRAAAKGLAVHYSAMLADWVQSHADCAARVRSIQRYHMVERGWLDIAYSWLVCHHGYRYMGRDLGVRTAAQGTTAGNDGYHAVCFLGADRDGRDDVTDPGRRAILDAVAEVRAWAPHARQIRPHSDFHATGCPGDELRRWIAAGCPTPGSPPTPAPAPPADWTMEVIMGLPLIDCRPGRPTTDRGPWVRKVQGLLVAHLTAVMPIDGIVGPMTHAAVLAFQRGEGLAVDGLVGSQTWTALLTR